MPMFAENFVDELKDRIDLYDLISPYVQLKKSGAKWLGLSPFNQEKTPSFYVDSIKGFFHCFSSGEKGDAFTFVQKVENLTFPEAIEFLANRFGIPIRYSNKRSDFNSTYQKSIKSELYKVNELACNWFAEQFVKDCSESKVAKNYWLKDRSFTLEDSKDFGIGYSPIDRFALGEFLIKKKIEERILEKSGLFNEKKQNGKLVTRFQGRLIIPIHEKIGRICGFTARVLKNTPTWGERKPPKYINTPETPIFSKKDLLFNLHIANKEISEEKDFLLVEGQLDAIRCTTSGFKTAIAPQGTSFGEAQAMLLRKSDPKGVTCLLDGDDAGQKAAFQYIPIFLKTGLNAQFCSLPKGKDPDQIILEDGPGELKKIIDSGISCLEYAVQFKLKGKKDPQPTEIQSICDLIFGFISEIDSLVSREGYLNELCKVLKISPKTISEEFSRFKNNKKPKYQNPPFVTDKISPKNNSTRLTTAEDDLLFCILHDKRVASPLAQIFDPTWLNLDVPAGRILAKIISEIKADGPIDENRMEEFLEDDTERNIFHQKIFQEVSSFDENSFIQHANECILSLFIRSIKNQEMQILKALNDRKQDDRLSKKLHLKLQKLRTSRKNPPLLILSEQNSSYSHA